MSTSTTQPTSTPAPTPRPLPQVTHLNRPFFAALADGELRLQRCTACDHLRYPIASVCPICLSASAQWELLSGRATVFSTVVFHQVYNQAFADQAPYNVAIVELDEGPMMMTNVVGCAPEAVRVDDVVQLQVLKLADGTHLPQFTVRSVS